MKTLIDIEENELNKLLIYTHAKTATEAVTKIIQDYLFQKDNFHHQAKPNVLQKKQLLKNIQNRFAAIPEQTSLADELIAERRLEVLKEIE